MAYGLNLKSTRIESPKINSWGLFYFNPNYLGRARGKKGGGDDERPLENLFMDCRILLLKCFFLWNVRTLESEPSIARFFLKGQPEKIPTDES